MPEAFRTVFDHIRQKYPSIRKAIPLITCVSLSFCLLIVYKCSSMQFQWQHKSFVTFPVGNHTTVESLPSSTMADDRKQRTPDCKKLFAGSPSEIPFIEKYMKDNPQEEKTSIQIINSTSNCKQYMQANQYLAEPTTPEEAEFPIAFVLTVYKDIGHLERLLRAIYSPQNLYCIHVDLNAYEDYFRAVTSLATCIDNVFLPSKRARVTWGKWEQVEAHLHCMRDLTSPTYWGKWKYLINLTGHEFPLQTNYVLVKALKAYNGSNDLSGSITDGRLFESRLNGELPFDAQFAKGEVHGLFTRKFVQFLLNDTTAQAIMESVRKQVPVCPDESAFHVLHFNPSLGAPGGFNGTDNQALHNSYSYWPVRYKHWAPGPIQSLPYANYDCFGEYSGGICQYGLKDVRHIIENAHKNGFLFLNKLRGSPYVVYDCIEQDFFERRKTQHLEPVNTYLWSSRNAAKFGRGDGL